MTGSACAPVSVKPVSCQLTSERLRGAFHSGLDRLRDGLFTPSARTANFPASIQEEFGPLGLSRTWHAEPVGIQNIAQGNDTFQLMHVSTTHYRQNVDLICAHALQRQIETLVGVDVRKNQPRHEFLQMPAGAFRLLSFERREIDNANHTSSIRHQPRSKFT